MGLHCRGGFILQTPVGRLLQVSQELGPPRVAIQSKTCHVQDVEQKKVAKQIIWWAVPGVLQPTPIWGKGRKFYVVLCRQVKAGGGVGCGSASPHADLGCEGSVPHAQQG